MGKTRSESGSKRLEKLDDYRWMIPPGFKPGMRVPGIIFASEQMIESVLADGAHEQVANAAFLPGIVSASLAMPDVHQGYGLPIGGVVAVDASSGVISPGGVGYDINCGVRLIATGLTKPEIAPHLSGLLDCLMAGVPAGLGSEGGIRLTRRELEQILVKGAHWAVSNGYGVPEDLEFCEETGRMEGGDPGNLSDKAFERGLDQLGTLGSGNHFLEVQAVDRIFDPKAAEAYGLSQDQIVIMIHSGSRGLGHQVCSDYLSLLQRATIRFGIELPDRQLACAPLKSDEGRSYFSAMTCAANYAWANRQCLTHLVREAFSEYLGVSPERLGLRVIWDVAHNIAKMEYHKTGSGRKLLCVHRKGATRAFPPGDAGLPPRYRPFGQPVLVPGDMGRCSYVLSGTPAAMDLSFGSTCHGAGRVMSRAAAKKRVRATDLLKKLAEQGTEVRASTLSTVAEEAPQAYKDVSEVVKIAEGAGLSRSVARLSPLGVLKG